MGARNKSTTWINSVLIFDAYLMKQINDMRSSPRISKRYKLNMLELTRRLLSPHDHLSILDEEAFPIRPMGRREELDQKWIMSI